SASQSAGEGADVSEYQHSAHAVWDIKYHLVWITKYRYKVLRGEVAERARDLLRQICAAREARIIRGAVSPDHVHMLVVVPPQLAPAKLVQFLKGRSSRMLQLITQRSRVQIPPPQYQSHPIKHLSRRDFRVAST